MATEAVDYQLEVNGHASGGGVGSGAMRGLDYLRMANGQKIESDPATPPARAAPPPGPDPGQTRSVQIPSPPPADLPEHQLERIPTFLQPSMPWRDRLMHFTFAWFTVTISTSGIALLLAITPHRFPGLSSIGLAIFLLDLVFFIFITLCIALRFVLYRRTLRRAFTRPKEALFVPCLFLSVCTIVANIAEYARLFLSPYSTRIDGPLADFLVACFWVYLALAFAFSVFQYHLLFTVKEERRLVVSAMTPAWILPIFPVMLAGTLACVCAKMLSAERALGVLCAGLAAQGLGLLISVFFYATYLSRLMVFGLPAQRPGMFIAVGPPSFTCAALLNMAGEVPRVFRDLGGAGTMLIGDQMAGADVETLALAVRLATTGSAVFLWGLSFWFFASATAAVVAGMPDRRFHLSWWSFVFPNVGFTFACVKVGVVFGSEGVLWFSTVMTAVLVVAWAFIGYRCIRAVYKREIVWPGHDEDES